MGHRVTHVLLDTHTLVWWLEGGERLSRLARKVLEDPSSAVFVSAATAWELAIKEHIGKFGSREFVLKLSHQLNLEGFTELPITVEHAIRAGGLGSRHKDPFDRMLAAQAQVEKLPILSGDKMLDGFSIQRIW